MLHAALRLLGQVHHVALPHLCKCVYHNSNLRLQGAPRMLRPQRDSQSSLAEGEIAQGPRSFSELRRSGPFLAACFSQFRSSDRTFLTFLLHAM